MRSSLAYLSTWRRYDMNLVTRPARRIVKPTISRNLPFRHGCMGLVKRPQSKLFIPSKNKNWLPLNPVEDVKTRRQLGHGDGTYPSFASRGYG